MNNEIKVGDVWEFKGDSVKVLFVDDRSVYYERESDVRVGLRIDHFLEYYTKRKKTKTVTLYRYLLEYIDGEIITRYWTNKAYDYDGDAKILKIETKEIEYDDE